MTVASLDIAVVQPAPVAGRNVELAVRAIDRAAALGAALVLFPEAFPGPMTAAQDYDPAPALRDAAAEHGVAVCWGGLEAAGDRWHMVAHVVGADGRPLLRYARGHPATGDVHPVLSGTAIAPGDGLATFDALGVRFGVLICSELWLPEIARVLAVRGAEVLLAPAGGGFGRVATNWRLIARARAIENQCHVALTQSLFGGESGSALIAGPERDVVALENEGVAVGTLDLERARWLRAQDDSMADPKPFSSLPGLLRARRPELYGELAEPREGLYDYEAAA